MNFESINQLRLELGLNSSSKSDLKKEVKAKIKEIHPDKNNGEFKTEEEKQNYQKLKSALDFLNSSTELVTREEITSLTKIIKDLALVKDEKRQESVLSDKIDSKIKSFKSALLFPKITSTSIAGLLSIIWLFPKTVSEHQVLSRLLNTSDQVFTTFWLFTLGLSAYLWFFLNFLERRYKQRINTLKLETTQNFLFNEFIRYKSYNVESVKNGFLRFSKEELIEFISNYNLNKKEYQYDLRYRSNKGIRGLKGQHGINSFVIWDST